ncbi:MAG: protein-tyrosine sulfotransferase [Robiginitomaculum sp.]|nr:MAG: protein-tyrosine sulfotransferase [Robiginitomaculum sp.]
MTKLQKGLQNIALGKYKPVHADALTMIHANVKDPVPYCLLGAIASEHGNHVKASELFLRAVSYAPTEVCYYAYAAQVLTVLGHQNQAKELADGAAGLEIKDAFIADTIGVVYSRTGFHEKAVPYFEKAVALNAAPANFHYNLGASQQFLGNFERAKQAYTQTLERDQDHYRAWSSLIGLGRQSLDDNSLDTLISLFEHHSDDVDAALHFGHAIAKTLEDLERYPESLNWLHKAKHKKKAALHKEAFAYGHMFTAAKQTFTSQTEIEPDVSTRAPIFIFGLPRTGTTLVDRIISSHPDVVSAGELNMFAGLIKEATRTSSNMVMDGETLAAAVALEMNTIGRQYIDNTSELARGAKRMTDKMPLNFFYAGLIHRALPNARLIVLRRGAMDSCLSNYRQLFTLQYSYYNYTYDLEDTAQFYSDFDALMTHWRNVLPANRFMEINYEDIVFDQEVQTRRLLEFCDLSWDEKCMRFHENEAPVSTASSVQVRQPLYSGSIGRWKKYGDKLEGLKEALGPLANGIKENGN